MAGFTSNILAVIVIYEKTLEESRSFQSIQPLLDKGLKVLIFDNSPSPQNIPEDLLYHHSPENKGVSGAYNFAAVKAKDLGCRWLWLLDDDTLVDPEFLNEAEAFANQDYELYVPKIYSNQRLLSPFGIKRSITFRLDHVNTGRHKLAELRPINSGMLISLAAFNKAGGYNPELPLDFSDIEFTDRLARVLPDLYVSKVHFEQAFSGDERPPFEKALTRFRTYARAASVYAESATHPKNVKKQLLRRAVRLSARYFSLSFISVFFKTPFGR
ncbi:MAG: glycosyltransferase [Owenweeksia sp.]